MRYHLLIPLLCFLISSCSEEDDKKDYRPDATGANGEVVVLCEDELWESKLGDTIRDVFTESLTGLPRPEPRFDLGRVNRSGLTETIQKHRNLFIVEWDKEAEKAARITVGEEPWAKDQVVVRLVGKDRKEMIRKFIESKDRIISRFDKAERERLMDGYEKVHSKELRKELLEEFGVGLKVPKDCRIKKEATDFVWLERHRMRNKGGRDHDVIQGVLIYKRPYTDKGQLEKENLLKARDSVLKEHVPGPSDSSYMTTETRFEEALPVMEEFELKGDYVAQIRGLWRVENDHMGGPFLSISTYDDEKEVLVTIDGFVFAPKFDKREYLRQVQAMIYSYEFADPEVSS